MAQGILGQKHPGPQVLPPELGQQVLAGEPLYEIETDKVVSQIEATESGVLKKQLCEEGDRIPVDGPVAVLETV